MMLDLPSLPHSEDRHPRGQEYWQECSMAPAAGQEVYRGAYTNPGNPGHQYTLEL